MNVFKFRTVLALLIFTGIGRAGRMDSLILRNPFPTGNETSTDLVNWLPTWTNTFARALNFTDPQGGDCSN